MLGTLGRRGAGDLSGHTMPIFDFHCESCDQTFELLVRNEAPVCPHCGSQRLEKLLSAPNVAGKSKKIIESARSQAAREGHFSHYSRSEKPRR